jgi:hypothetical protein
LCLEWNTAWRGVPGSVFVVAGLVCGSSGCGGRPVYECDCVSHTEFHPNRKINT